MLQTLNTIHEAEKVYPTGGRPILVTCNDVQDWVCKHNHPKTLAKEIIGSEFAKVWGLQTPKICLINVAEDHIPKSHINSLQPINFRRPCFGSLYLRNCKELDSSTNILFNESSFRRKLKSKEDFLKIALFDIWLCNEDRNHNNSNLLIDFEIPDEISFCVFDHGEIFNSNFLDHPLYTITEDESIIKTDLAKKLFRRGHKLTDTVNNLVENFYLCVSECESNVNDVIRLIPEDWNIDTDTLEIRAREQLFKKEWLHECETAFRSFIQINLNNR